MEKRLEVKQMKRKPIVKLTRRSIQSIEKGLEWAASILKNNLIKYRLERKTS